MSLQGGVSVNTRILYVYYVIIVSFVMSLLSTLSSKLILVYRDEFIKRAYDLEQYLTTCKKKSKTCFSKKRVSTARNTIGQIKLVQYPLLRLPKILSGHGNIRYWINLLAERQIPNSTMSILQLGSASTFQYLYQLRPTWLHKQPFL